MPDAGRSQLYEPKSGPFYDIPNHWLPVESYAVRCVVLRIA
jgi:hypothetical protein